jgi:hypothetical protein
MNVVELNICEIEAPLLIKYGVLITGEVDVAPFIKLSELVINL